MLALLLLNKRFIENNIISEGLRWHAVACSWNGENYEYTNDISGNTPLLAITVGKYQYILPLSFRALQAEPYWKEDSGELRQGHFYKFDELQRKLYPPDENKYHKQFLMPTKFAKADFSYGSNKFVRVLEPGTVIHADTRDILDTLELPPQYTSDTTEKNTRTLD